jgi:hypothetical protein
MKSEQDAMAEFHRNSIKFRSKVPIHQADVDRASQAEAHERITPETHCEFERGCFGILV